MCFLCADLIVRSAAGDGDNSTLIAAIRIGAVLMLAPRRNAALTCARFCDILARNHCFSGLTITKRRAFCVSPT